MAKKNNEVMLYEIIIKNLLRFDVINKYAGDIQEKINELIEEITAGSSQDAVLQHCAAINIFAQDIIRQTEIRVEDIPEKY